MKALEVLVKTSDPAELDHVLRESPAFAKLSPESQLRYLMTAELDTEIVKTKARCHFDQPLAGYAGQDLLIYFSNKAGGIHESDYETVTDRSVYFPQGLVALDHDGVPYYIDNYGQVLRIQPEKLKDYEPPPGR